MSEDPEGRARRMAIASDIIAGIKRVLPVPKRIKKIVPKRFGLEKGEVILRTMGRGRMGLVRFGMERGRIVTKRYRAKTPKTIGIKDAISAGKKNLLMHVEINENARKWDQFIGAQHLAGRVIQTGLIDDLKKVLRTMYYDLYRYINDKKAQMIPTNTGALKRSLLRSLTLKRGGIMGGELTVEIGTNLPYLEFVHEMETTGTKPHLRHPKYAKKNPPPLLTSDPTKASYLPEIDDPKAVRHFLDFIIIAARKQANKIFSQRVTEMVYQKWKNFFGWTRWTQATVFFNRVRW